MRKFRSILALVLALVMSMGMVAFAEEAALEVVEGIEEIVVVVFKGKHTKHKSKLLCSQMKGERISN